MLVTLHNFKCYQDQIFKFGTGVNLLKGASGKGKSTILNAIGWCLYGGIIRDLEGKKRKSHVQVDFLNDLTIRRQKNPSLLVVTINNIKYEGNPAQAIIDSKFGSKSVWTCSGYLMQGERNALISYSDKDKIDILNSFAFRDEDPSEIIQRIKTCMDAIESDYLSMSNQYQIKYGVYCKWAESVRLSSLIRPEYDNDKLKVVIDDLKRELNLTNKRIQENNQKKWQTEQLTQTINKLEGELKLIILDDINNIESELKELRYRESISRQHNNVVGSYLKVKSELDIIDLNLPENDSYLNLNVNELKRQHLDHNNNQSKAINLEVEYNKSAIESKINQLQHIIDGQRNAQLKQELNTLHRQLSSFPDQTVTSDDISEIERTLACLTERITYLKCPHCNNSVQHINSQLVKRTESPSNQQEIKICKDKLVVMRQNYQLSCQKINVQLRIDTSEKLLDNAFEDVSLLSSYEVGNIKNQINKLRSITIIEPVVIDIIIVEKVQARHRLRSQIDNIKKSTTYDVTKYMDTTSKDKIQQLERKLKLNIELTARKSIIESSINDNRSRLDKVGIFHNIDINVVNELSDKIDKYEKDILVNNIIMENIKFQNEINDIVNKSNAIRKEHESMKRLLETAKQLERITLQHVIDMINADIADILGVIFSDPITVSLELFRETKDHQMKPVVNIKISYKGIEYSKVSELSGGEADRISLAISLSFNKSSGNSILLLDEVLSSLDMNAKELCLNVIKNYTGKKIFLAVDHEGTEGFYDSVVSVE